MSQGAVVLLHGLGRSHLSMRGLQRHLERQGHRTWARSYPSRRMGVGELAALVGRWLAEDLGQSEFSVVTHSLGGILVRHLPAELRIGRTVMLAPPNQGSRLADRLRRAPVFERTLGPAMGDLAAPGDWPAPRAPFGIIAGTRAPSLGNPASWVSARLGVFEAGEPNDGTVATAETRLPGMADYAEVDASHTWIMSDPRVWGLVSAFLRDGRF